MAQTKESELIIALLLYAMRCRVEGDLVALRHMNFGPHEIDALHQINLADLYRVETLRAHCLDIRLNRDVFNAMVQRLIEQRQSEDIQQILIAQDAPLEMMYTLFGMSAREYSRLRRTMTLKPAIGRPPELDEDDTHALWHAYQAIVNENAPCLPPDVYLQLSEQTGIGLRALWTLIQRWSTTDSELEGCHEAR